MVAEDLVSSNRSSSNMGEVKGGMGGIQGVSSSSVWGPPGGNRGVVEVRNEGGVALCPLIR